MTDVPKNRGENSMDSASLRERKHSSGRLVGGADTSKKFAKSCSFQQINSRNLGLLQKKWWL